MAYGPLEPSNRLEWFLANGGGSGGDGDFIDFFEAFALTVYNQLPGDLVLFYPAVSPEGVSCAASEIIGNGDSNVRMGKLKDGDTINLMMVCTFNNIEVVVSGSASADVSVFYSDVGYRVFLLELSNLSGLNSSSIFVSLGVS